MNSATRLVVIDVWRQGAPTLFPLPLPDAVQDFADYNVCLHRAGKGYSFEVWPVPLRQRLPRICIPLSHGDPDIALDVQSTFDRAYDDGLYHKRVDYAAPPTPDLSAADADWADALLHEAGLRA